jgi:hypothetical protein
MRWFALVLALAAAGACSDAPREVLRLNSGTLTVDNQSDEEWRSVEIWVNNYYRALVPSIAAHGVFQVRLDSFVSGYGQRFDRDHAPVTDLRLKAKRANGDTFEVKKDFQGNPLQDALGGKY